MTTPEPCKYCGAHIEYLGGSKARSAIKLNYGTLAKHECKPTAARVYTPEERQEFQRRREAGEI